MKNIHVEKKKNNLVIHLPLEKPRLSKSAKTLVVGGTGGVMRTQVSVNGEAVYIIATAYTYKPEAETHEAENEE